MRLAGGSLCGPLRIQRDFHVLSGALGMMMTACEERIRNPSAITYYMKIDQ
jgi:hypothetical protein